jgi:hypothetical protein
MHTSWSVFALLFEVRSHMGWAESDSISTVKWSVARNICQGQNILILVESFYTVIENQNNDVSIHNLLLPDAILSHHSFKYQVVFGSFLSHDIWKFKH